MAKYLDSNGLIYLWSKIKEAFVAKESGKGLSSNDYTSAEKTKLSGIETGANKYVHPTKTAADAAFRKVGNDESGHVVAGGEVTKADITALGIPAQDTTYGAASTAAAGLMSAEDKTKLNGIAAGANAYTHPTQEANTATFRKVGNDASGHVVAGAAITKSDITALGIPAQDTTYIAATTAAAGLMSAADKTKLNSVAEGAEANVQSDWNATSGDALILNKPTIPTVPAISTDVDTDGSSNTKTVSPKAVKDYVDGKVSAVYRPAGSTTFAELPAASASTSGNVYNVSTAFTTTTSFVEGAGKTYPAGTNVAVVEPTSGTYKYDVLAGFVDLSGYVLSSDVQAVTNAEIDVIAAS